MKMRNESKRNVNGWISVAADLPDDDETVLLCHPSNDEPVWPGYRCAGYWYSADGMPLAGTPVTHWQRMPEPPMVARLVDFK